MTVISEERAKNGYQLGTGEGEAHWLLGMLETSRSGRRRHGRRVRVARGHRACRRGIALARPPRRGRVVLRARRGVHRVRRRAPTLALPAGSFAFGPKGVPSHFHRRDGRAKALIGFQPFISRVSCARSVNRRPSGCFHRRSRLPGHGAAIPIAARNGMEILGPPGPPPVGSLVNPSVRLPTAPLRRRSIAAEDSRRLGSRRLSPRATFTRFRSWSRRRRKRCGGPIDIGANADHMGLTPWRQRAQPHLF